MTIPPRNRNDPALASDEIELAPAAGLAIAPVRVKACESGSAISRFQKTCQEADKEIAAAQARREEARLAALAIQGELEELVGRRDGLAAMVKRGEDELASVTRHAADLESWIAAHWSTQPLHDQLGALARHEAMLVRLPKWISGWKTDLAATEKELAAFKDAHGIP